MAYDYNHSVISRLEDKWLDPDYDFYGERTFDDDEDEETYITLEEYFELVNNRK